MSHCQDNNTEDLLRLLLRSDGSKFKEDIVKIGIGQGNLFLEP